MKGAVTEAMMLPSINIELRGGYFCDVMDSITFTSG
jgi:hypothetical protein